MQPDCSTVRTDVRHWIVNSRWGRYFPTRPVLKTVSILRLPSQAVEGAAPCV